MFSVTWRQKKMLQMCVLCTITPQLLTYYRSNNFKNTRMMCCSKHGKVQNDTMTFFNAVVLYFHHLLVLLPPVSTFNIASGQTDMCPDKMSLISNVIKTANHWCSIKSTLKGTLRIPCAMHSQMLRLS